MSTDQTMNDPFVSFDTFSVGEEADLAFGKPPQEPAPTPILARLPRVTAPPRPKPVQRFDDAEPATHGLHHPEAGYDLAPAAPFAESPQQPKLTGDPIATLRIDTVAPTLFTDAPAPLEKPRATPQPAVVKTSDPTDDPWAAWLLNLESAILPYSRVIVLAAVIAAMGLTVVLLRGGSGTSVAPNPELAPQVNLGTTNDGLAATEENSNTVPKWPVTPTTNEGLKPLDEQVAVETDLSSTIASGPASAPRATAHATLTGEVRPVRIDVADATSQPSYPRTQR